MQWSAFLSTKLFFENDFGSTVTESIFVNILNLSETLASYPYDEWPYDKTPLSFNFSSKGSIIFSLKDIFLIHLSDIIGMLLPFFSFNQVFS